MIVTFVVNTIRFTDDAGNNITDILKTSVASVASTFVPASPVGEDARVYPYPTITQVCLQLDNGGTQRFECQDVTNQPGWSGGAQADVNQAQDDIQAFL